MYTKVASVFKRVVFHGVQALFCGMVQKKELSPIFTKIDDE